MHDTNEPVAVPDEPIDRRRVLQLGGAGAVVAVSGGRIGMRGGRGNQRERTRAVARRLLAAIATTDSSVIWANLVPGAVISFPFIDLVVTDQATFDVTVGPLLSDLIGFTISEPTFVDLEDERAVIIKYTGVGVVGSTGKTYDQTYISELHVRGDKVASYTEYFDTAVINEAFTP